MVYLWDGGKRERAERYPWDQVCFCHPSFSIIHQALLKRCFIDFLMRGGAMAFQGVSLSLFASLELSVCFAVLLYNHNKKSFSLYGCRFLFFCEKELCLIGAKNKLPDKLFHVCWRGVREREREREQGKGKERRQHVDRVYYKHTGALSMRIQEKKRLTGGKRDGERSRKRRSD